MTSDRIGLWTLLTFAGLSVSAARAESPPGPECTSKADQYRKVTDDQVGNCIFSTKPLPFCKEDAFTDVRARFTAGKDSTLYARCYYRAPMGEIRKSSKKILREMSRIVVDGKDRDPRNNAVMIWGKPSADWKFASSDELLGANRTFKHARFEEETKDAKGDHKVCISQTFEEQSGTKLARTAGGGSTVVPIATERLLATGCFTWVVP